MSVYWVLAIVHVARDEFPLALEHAENALELATMLKDARVCAECAYLAASLLSTLGRFREAVACDRLALESLRSLRAEDTDESGREFRGSADCVLELQILSDLASDEFVLAHFEAASAYLLEARRLLSVGPERRLSGATIAWVSALLHRWKGEPEAALRQAMAACEVIGEVSTPTSYARIQTIVADVALDLAESYPPHPPAHARDAFVALAHPYIVRSLRLTQDAQDPTGQGVAQLARTRYNRLCLRAEDNISLIEEVMHLARRLGDTALLCQAHTALGNELAARGEKASALNCWQAALDSLTGSDMPAMGVWSRRALLRAAEVGD